jgi:hypothetical protein
MNSRYHTIDDDYLYTIDESLNYKCANFGDFLVTYKDLILTKQDIRSVLDSYL